MNNIRLIAKKKKFIFVFIFNKNKLSDDCIWALLTNTESRSDDEDVDDDMSMFNHSA
jgi:hypothetical protein